MHQTGRSGRSLCRAWRKGEVIAVMRDAPVVSKKLDFASGMAQRVMCCSHEGCTSHVQNGGLCIRHDAVRVKCCNHKGCTSHVQNGGLCMRHGAKVKHCSNKGCAKHAKRGGLCVGHGGWVKVKCCSPKSCTSHTQKEGLCKRHGATVMRCYHEGCTKNPSM